MKNIKSYWAGKSKQKYSPQIISPAFLKFTVLYNFHSKIILNFIEHLILQIKRKLKYQLIRNSIYNILVKIKQKKLKVN